MGFGTLLAMLILTGSVGYYSTSRVIAAAEDVSFSLKRKEAATAVELEVRKQIRSASYYVFNGDSPSLQQYGQDKQEVAQRLGELSKMLSSDKGKALLSNIRQSTGQMSDLTDQEISLQRQKRSYEATSLTFGSKTQATMNALMADCNELEAWEDKLGQDQLNLEHQTESRANGITLLLVACSLFLGIVIAILIARSITGSMSRMLWMIQSVSAKDLSVDDVQVTSNDEIGQAEVALNSMKNTLHEMVQSIAATSEHLASASEEISSGATQSVETARVQAGQTLQVVTAMQQMSSTVHQVSEHSQKASDSSHKAA
ncbi:MAG: HAMP domain-containing protein [Candidatus Sulfotelmatobacter sp.]